MLVQLRNFDDVIKVLGGPTAVGRLTGQLASGVCNWKRPPRPAFPPKYYLIISAALEERGYTAHARLYGFVNVRKNAA